ncbi:MAG: manganese efflux pump [Bacteroidales bacterium]|nr:manganese efflux pump [Bacteroidales bacterium]
MSILNIFLIAIGISMDCFSVAACEGLATRSPLPRHSNRQTTTPLLMAIIFGLFQGMMPLIGYFAGSLFTSFTERFAPWIALILLGCIGSKMIYESFKPEKLDTHNGLSLRMLLALAFATSIDALVTGVVFVPYPEIIWRAIGIIALTGYLFSIVGFVIGKLAGDRFHFNAKLIGGIDLILIGLKIFLEGIIK